MAARTVQNWERTARRKNAKQQLRDAQVGNNDINVTLTAFVFMRSQRVMAELRKGPVGLTSPPTPLHPAFFRPNTTG